MRIMILHTTRGYSDTEVERKAHFMYGPFPSWAAAESWMNENSGQDDLIVVDLDNLPEAEEPDWAHRHMYFND